MFLPVVLLSLKTLPLQAREPEIDVLPAAGKVNYNEQLETLEKRFLQSKQALEHKVPETIEEVRQQLSLMVEIDQAVRKLWVSDLNNPKILALVGPMDDFHLPHLKAILAVHGWPIISKFGAQADSDAWLLVQHAVEEELEFQKSCLATLEKLLPLQEIDQKHYAYLYDRVALRRGLKQRYGTQADDKSELSPFEGTLEDLNARRHAIGLPPVEEYMKVLKEMYKQKHAPCG